MKPINPTPSEFSAFADTVKQYESSKPPTIIHSISNDEARARWIDTIQTTDDGSNNHLADFIKVMTFIQSNYRTFTFNEVVSYAKNFEKPIPTEKLRRLFDSFTLKLEGWNKLARVNGCYDDITWVCLS